MMKLGIFFKEAFFLITLKYVIFYSNGGTKTIMQNIRCILNDLAAHFRPRYSSKLGQWLINNFSMLLITYCITPLGLLSASYDYFS